MTKTFIVRDEFFQKAKQDGYRARSAYKLKEIQTKFRIIKKGDSVLDLGASPGSFMQVILELVGETGQVFGVDLQEIDAFDKKNSHTLKADIFDKEKVLNWLSQKTDKKLNVLTSDLAPSTSGIKDIDQGRSIELADQAFYLAKQTLKPGGHFVAKVFEGEDFQWFLKRVKRDFKTVKIFKPSACRDRSYETYIVGLQFKAT